MTLILSGSDGLSDVDGSAATPAIRGTDANTGIFFPAADTIAFSEGGVEAARIDSGGNFGLGVTPSAWGSGLKAVEIGGANSYMAFNNTSASGYVYWNMWNDGTNNKTKQTGNIGAYGLSTGGAHVWFNGTGTTGATSSLTQAMTLNANGVLALQGASTSANGIGITFPATQSASSDANTLDDYEEGSWTPVLRGSGTAGTFNLSTATGKYTKIGNMVTLYCAITLTSITGSPTGDLQITGAPFACAAGTSASGATQTQLLGITQAPSVSFSTRGASSILYLTYVNASQIANVIAVNTVANTAIVDFCISYPTT